MAVRALLDLGPGPYIKTLTVVAAGSTVEGRPISLNNSDEECTITAAGASCDGIALETKAAGERVQVLMGDGLVKVKVGTGGATRGLYAVVVADGVTNSATLGGGTVVRHIVGKFLQTGVAGDVVGLRFSPFAAVSA
jgi:pyruvate kinase